MPPYLTFTKAKVKIKLLSYFFPNPHGCIVNSNSIPIKSHTNQPRQTLSDQLKLEKSLTKHPNPMLFTISKQSFSELPSQLMPRVISRVITSKDKMKPPYQRKSQVLSKSVVSFQSSPVPLRGESLHTLRDTSIRA